MWTPVGTREQQDLLKAKYPPMDPFFPFGANAHDPHAVTQARRFGSPEEAPAVPRKISLSAVRSAAYPNLGDPADAQKLAASWVTHQLYCDTADQVSSFAVVLLLKSLMSKCHFLVCM